MGTEKSAAIGPQSAWRIDDTSRLPTNNLVAPVLSEEAALIILADHRGLG